MADDQFDIYISFAPEDEERVSKIVHELEWNELKVWFRNQPSTPAESQAILRQRMSAGACHVVVLSKNSAGSGRIQSEARTSSGMQRLIFVRIDANIVPPRDTVAIAYADLVDWTAGSDHKGMRKLLGGIRTLTGKGPAPAEQEAGQTEAPRSNNEFGANAEPLTQEQKDERAWQTCISYNNRTYYEHYLRFFPTGKYAREAQERLSKKKRTTAIVITCAVIYLVAQVLVGILTNIGKF